MSGTTSGTRTWTPNFAELVLDAYERARVDVMDQGGVNAQYADSARRSMNLILQRWANRGIMLAEIELVTVSLSIGQGGPTSPIAVAQSVMDLLNLYCTVGGVDILCLPLSREDYASLPMKAQAGRPTCFWFERLATPQLYLWPVPDQTGLYSISYYAAQRIQDADMGMGQIPDLVNRFWEPFTAALAAHLAMKFSKKPDGTPDLQLTVALDAYAERVFNEAAAEDREKTPLRIAPSFTAYF